jgi:DNA helicase-2/ATP-dependent DNA helicase PcrA
MTTEKSRVTHTPFDEQYGRLNEQQKKAVDTIEGPVMVIAGPGTGKTQILALRIANILRLSDTAPSSILALTFTESGVASMRARLVSLMGQDGYRVRVHTFHGFCNEVIRMYPDRFPSIIGRTPLIELDGLAIVKALLDELRPKLLRPHGKPDFYVRDIMGKLSEVKREHITPVMLMERIVAERLRVEQATDLYHEKGAHKGKMKGKYSDELRSLLKAEEFVAIYGAYEEALEKGGLYDFEDTIIAVIETLAKDEELKLILQEEHQYILADEHQDANGSQNELLVLLSDFHPEPNLFIVGDEKQAIYRFQGASLENFFSFKRRYKNAVLIPLSENYRSTQRILDAAHALIAPARGQAEIERVSLVTQGIHEEQEIALVRAPDEDTEYGYITDHIANYIKDGTSAHEIAILVRRNSDVPELASALQHCGIPHIAHGDDPVLTNPTVQGFVMLLRAVASFGEDAPLYPVLTLPYTHISNLDIYRLTNTPLYKSGALYALLSDELALEALGVRDKAACKALYKLLDGAARALRELPLLAALEQVFSQSGCLSYILAQPDALATLDVMRAFLRYAKTLLDAHATFTLPALLNAFEEAKEHRLSLGGNVYHRENAVCVMTVHRAKGREFDHVFIPHMHDRLWGSRRHVEHLKLPLFSETAGAVSDTSEDDERRLLYVAMTRARKTLIFSYAEVSNDGVAHVPSRFVEEIKAHVIEKSIPVRGASFSVAVSAEGSRATLSDEEKMFLRTRLSDQGLSVTALNNYLESPWKYFFLNLLRIPQVRSLHLLYGSAIDAALKWYTQKRKEETSGGVLPATEEVVTVFVSALMRQPLTKKDFETYRARGVAALIGYLAKYADTWLSDTESAIHIKVPFETGIPELPVIMLRGELDKVEHPEDGWVRIVDYKTGKPKTRGEIEGTTKTSNGNLKRQLVFYRLLVERDAIRQWRGNEATLDFVEPDVKGNYHQELYRITDADVADLTTTIQKTVRDINEFAFWEDVCDEAAWSKEGCSLVNALKNRQGLFR